MDGSLISVEDNRKMEDGTLLEQIMKLIVEGHEGGKLINLSLAALNEDSLSLIAIYGLAEGCRREHIWAEAFEAFRTLNDLQEQSGNIIIDQKTVEKLMNGCFDEFMMEVHSLLFVYATDHIKTKAPALIDRNITEAFEKIGEANQVDFLDFIERMHANFPRDCVLFFSSLFFATGYGKALDRIENLIMRGCFDYDVSRGLLISVEMQRFDYAIASPDYAWQRDLLDVVVDKFKKAFVSENRVIPVNDRASNRIVVTTWQMISMQHAPSRMVYRLCRCLQEVLHYEVLLVVCPESIGTVEACEGILVETSQLNIDKKIWGLNRVQYVNGDCYIRTLQFPITCSQSSSVNELINYIIDFNPVYVWNVGGSCCLAEYLGEVTTLASMPCRAGLSVSNADFLIRYMKLNDGSEQEEFAKKKGQTILDINWVEEKPDLISINREELAILGPNSFLIGIMGNRLDTELTDDFLDMMQEVVKSNPQVVYIIIGECNLNLDDKELGQNVKKLGYREDFMSVFRTLDLMINPKRSGAGSTALAVLVGTPVITLPNCDVASAVGSDAFICDDYSEYFGLIDKYINDPEFMKSQVEECNIVEKRMYRVTIEDEIQRIDGLIREKIGS